MNRQRIWMWARLAGGAAILAVLIWKVGAAPFVDGLRRTTVWALVAALAITALTTLCCAWRWSLIAGALGADVPLPAAVGAYYRSQFLNSTLPGGMLGDVHRGVVHGRLVGDMSRGLRSVVWDRLSGQTVQILVTVAVLLVMPLPAAFGVPVTWLLALIACVALVVVLARMPNRVSRAVTSDLRNSVLAKRVWPAVAVASIAAVAGHVGVFVIAAQVVGVELAPGLLLPLALLVLLGAALPVNIAGWGPREGAAAWAFGAIGLSAADGVTVSVVYGVLALVATLPGGVLLLLRRRIGGVVHA